MISQSFLPDIGGLQFQVKYLTEELARQNIEIFLLSNTKRGEDYIEKNKNGFPKFLRLRKDNIFIELIELYRLLQKISPDIVHVHGAEYIAFQLTFLKFLRLLSYPIIITSHGVDVMTYKEVGYGHRLNIFRSLIIRFILNQCTRHVIVGNSMRSFALDAGTKKEKLKLIPNGVPLKIRLEKIEDVKIKSVLQKYDLSKSDYLLLSLSGMRPLKGIEYLVKSFVKVLEEFPNAKLFLAGKSNDAYEKYIRELVMSLGIGHAVKFIGFVVDEKEKRILLQRCDIFCKPSLLEACSVAILEAMKEGRVVVATEPGGIDIIIHERNGLLTRVKDPNDFAQSVIRIFKDNNLRTHLEIYAKQDIQKFDIQKTALAYQSLYSSLLL